MIKRRKIVYAVVLLVMLLAMLISLCGCAKAAEDFIHWKNILRIYPNA